MWVNNMTWITTKAKGNDDYRAEFYLFAGVSNEIRIFLTVIVGRHESRGMQISDQNC